MGERKSGRDVRSASLGRVGHDHVAFFEVFAEEVHLELDGAG